MVRGRARAAVAGAVVVCSLGTALAASGCGASEHPNNPRPSVSTRVSIVVNPHQVLVQKGDVAQGEEQDQQIPQNRGAKQPPIKTSEPLDVTFVAANQTGEPTQVVVEGPTDVESRELQARSPTTFGGSLETGDYTVVAKGIPGARPAHFTVGAYRASSQNDLLLP